MSTLKKPFIVLCFFLLQTPTLVFGQLELALFDQAQREKIANELFDGIERLDAITIELRNETRDVTWDAFKAFHSKRIIEADNWPTFYYALDEIHFGIINRHSYLLLEENIAKQAGPRQRWPQLEIGYTWPDIAFFSIESNKTIKTINGQSIHQLFDEFYNYYCNDAHKSGCLRLFSNYVSSGYSFAGDANKLKVQYSDDSEEDIVKQPRQSQRRNEDEVGCEQAYRNIPTTLRYKAENACLFETPSAFLLKISSFHDRWGANNIYCEGTVTEGMCRDIRAIADITESQAEKTLIVDLQNNGDGAENTVWVAALTHQGFKDNIVAYKNLKVLGHQWIQKYAFNAHPKGYAWYDEVKDSKEHFLPPRADFCTSDKGCDIETIPSSPHPIRYSSIKVITNEGCVSSCDDLVWRLNHHASSTTYGQYAATDGAFARLKGHLVWDKDGNIKTFVTGQEAEPEFEKHQVLLTYVVPITKTLNEKGENLEGHPGYLDHPLPITKQNFHRIEEANVQRVLALIE